MIRLVPIIYTILVVYLVNDCYRNRREFMWYLILLIPGWGVILYVWRFKMSKDPWDRLN